MSEAAHAAEHAGTLKDTQGAADDAGSGSARAARERGRQALRDQDRQQAILWLDRAHRLAPEDAMGALLLASALTGTDDARAHALLLTLTATHPAFWAAQTTLAAIQLRQNDAHAAAATLGAMLARAAPPADPGFPQLADQIARRAGLPGWIGLSSTGVTSMGLATAGYVQQAAGVFRLDNRRIWAGPRPPGGQAGRTLPEGWQTAARLTATQAARHFLGSPLDIAAHLETSGFVAAAANGDLTGWAWHPNDPDQPATLRIHAAGRAAQALLVTADDSAFVPLAGDGVGQPRGFHVPRTRLPQAAILHVTGLNGAPLFGSPLHTQGKPSPLGKLPARTPPRAPIDIVIPVYRGAADFLACLAGVRRRLPAHARIVVIDDASPDPALRQALDHAATTAGLLVLRHPHNQGFPAAANTGLRHAAGRDVVLLNPDTLVPPDWLTHLAQAAYAAPDIGSVTPLTNDATITAYPAADPPEPFPDQAATDRLHALCRTANAGQRIDLPTAVGFCMFIRHDCLADTGLFREDLFAQGYGEENDWSLRAAARGWRHVADPASFVAHAGGRSFGGAKAALLARNLDILHRLHPGYAPAIARFVAADPLAPARRRIDTLRWRAAAAQGAVILITHDQGGGVQRHVQERAATLRRQGLRPIILSPAPLSPAPPGPDPETRRTTLSDDQQNFPNLRFDAATDLPALADFLRPDRPLWAELHHLVGHAPAIAALPAALAIPYDVVIHDFALICPRITLCGPTRSYCGEPVDTRDCDACVADTENRLQEPITTAALRARTTALLAAARTTLAPTTDTARRLARYTHSPITTHPWQPNPHFTIPRPTPHPHLTVCVLGGISEHKGFHVLLACARDSARRNLPLSFRLVGHTADDSRLIDTTRVTITGLYTEAEAVPLVQAQHAGLAFLPSVWPETWCYALTTLWQAGLWPVAFNLGAQAERISATGQGTLIPLGLPSSRINDFLLELAPARMVL